MMIELPKEIKNNENNVYRTRGSLKVFTKRAHAGYAQQSDGEGSGFSDEA